MFSIFKNNSTPQSPLNELSRQRVEAGFAYLVNVFSPAAIRSRKVLLPHHSDFPIRYNGDPQTATDTLEIVAAQMEIAMEDIELNIYDDTINALSTGAPGGVKIFLGSEPDLEPDLEPDTEADTEQPTPPPTSTRNTDGKFSITIEKSKLQNPELLVAKLAYELAPRKLELHDKMVLDLTTLVFGLGIFNANASFITKSLQRTDRLNQMEWGYALALFAHFRNEKSPAWAEHLVKNIKSDFAKSQQYLNHQNRQ